MLALAFWDASALVKRYTAEQGTDTVNALFSALAGAPVATTALGYAEAYSILVRRLNGAVIDTAAFRTAVSALQQEVVGSSGVGLLPLSAPTIFASTGLISRHNLNATDAALLMLLLEYAAAAATSRSSVLLISADRRFLRAAGSEGLSVINPEELPAADLPALIACI